jgi:glycosyltransferase involved in cell wall biosynthesis
MKTVLMISPDISVKGGISSMVNGLLNTDLSKKYKIILISSHVDGSKIRKLIQAIVGLMKAFYYLVSNKINIVHIHGSDPISFKRKYVFFRLAHLFRKKIVYHFHGWLLLTAYPSLSNAWKKRFIELYELSNVVICLSESAKKGILSIVPKANIIVASNSVALPKFDQGAAFADKTETIQLMFLGHIKEMKGIYDLLNAVKCLSDKGIEFHLSIGGIGETERLRDEITRLSLESKVAFLGWISERDRDSLLRRTDIFILPSYSEAMPMSILEAMSYAVPVISTRVGGIPELVIDGETGYLVKPGDLENLHRKILELILDKEERVRLGNRGRQVIEKNHNLDVNIKKIEDIYSSL